MVKVPWALAFKSKPFNLIRHKKIVETVAVDFLKVLKAGGSSTNVWLRIVHGCALRWTGSCGESCPPRSL
jgi:hypothetical protein